MPTRTNHKGRLSKRYAVMARKVQEREARGEELLVIVLKPGKPPRVWGLEEYLARQELTRKVKPWEKRKVNAEVPDPLGAVDGTVLLPVTRAYMYEDDD